MGRRAREDVETREHLIIVLVDTEGASQRGWKGRGCGSRSAIPDLPSRGSSLPNQWPQNATSSRDRRLSPGRASTKNPLRPLGGSTPNSQCDRCADGNQKRTISKL